MFKALKNNKIIAINDSGGFPCLVYDDIIEEKNLTIEDFIHINGEFLPKSDPVASAYITEKAKNDEIAELKQKLSDSDYAVIKIAEGAATAEDYAELIEQRQAWRARINELEAANG